jgi:hypothetical protein
MEINLLVKQTQRKWRGREEFVMTTKHARRAFRRSYHVPAILINYPRLVRAMQGVARLSGIEARPVFATSKRVIGGAAPLSMHTAEHARFWSMLGNTAEQ